MRFLLALAAVAMNTSCMAAGSVSNKIECSGLSRSYVLHVPENLPADRPAPLVLVFHGSGSDGADMEQFSKFSALADREGFIAAYPDAIGKNWNDGRKAASIRSQAENIDDVGFTAAVIDAIAHDCSIDPNRIYATGFSNGGIFMHMLANKLAQRLAAIADVSGGIAEPLAPEFKPQPLSVLIIHGTKDPFVPYDGGNVDYSDNGRVISTGDTIKKWIAANGGDAKSNTGELPDINKSDDSEVMWTRWNFRKTKTELLLFRIEGGGHTWPGGPQFLPVAIIGHVDRDIDAASAIWAFFKKHPKP